MNQLKSLFNLLIFSGKKSTFFFLGVLLFLSYCATVPTQIVQHKFHPVLTVKEFAPKEKTLLPAIVLYEPVLLKDTVLFRTEDKKEKGLIPFFLKNGYTVYLISSKETFPSFRNHALEFDSILNQIAEKQREREIYLGGVSLGGQAVLEYMTIPSSLENQARVSKIFFIGTGIDYNYSNSFTEHSTKKNYEETFVKDICPKGSKDNFCKRYIRFNNELQNMDNREKETFFDRIPKLKNDFLTRFHKTKLQLGYFLIYGKLDSISPEESIFPFFDKIRSSSKMDSSNRMFEASEANGQSIDYDHADLFLYPDVEKEVYRRLLYWLKRI
ncbi:MAG TPA: hypothetical protein PK079_18405 [Leptospiraceae bacterium]|nr:hypothetical protein [Leptospiraceae bacterium]HMW05583.1 hypothetical protein [Leptospiraceae bacterium]HMX33542.1 hypothetical protein [Leptospiraceae bacterium]HMY31093.1 hypothetical protein [Leptospiraceae bacterium]HMZ66969.1 hypothetical protein [Leptospiraceae bacterium]